jgi:hypothetical protein
MGFTRKDEKKKIDWYKNLPLPPPPPPEKIERMSLMFYCSSFHRRSKYMTSR